MSRSYGDRGDKDNKVRLLKKQVEFLKREISRLKKELSKAQDLEGGVVDARDEHKPLKEEGPTCQECGRGTYRSFEIKLLDGSTRTYLTCPVCGHSKTQKAR